MGPAILNSAILLEDPGAEYYKLVFDPWGAEVTGGVLREGSLSALAPYYAKNKRDNIQIGLSD